MLTAWRIVKTRHAASAFDGEGARVYGGRWTSVGRPAVYTSSTVALATLELLVHLDATKPLAAYSLFEIGIPEALVVRLDLAALPETWRDFPAPPELRALGDRWRDARNAAVLEVPSAVTAVELNYLLNPEHPDFRRITIGPRNPYEIDPRLPSGVTRPPSPRSTRI